MLPSAVTLTAAVDGYARDANRDGVFTVLETAGTNLLVRSTTGTNTGFERSMIEFDLSQISTALTVNSATLVLDVSQFTKSTGQVFPSVDVYGYTGDGSIDLTDASAPATFIGHTSVTATGQLKITLDSNFVRSQGGGFIGIRLQNPVLNGPYAVFSALEAAAADPQLEIDTSLNVNIPPVNINEQRPNGTFVVDAGIGNNATYLKLSGDPTNVFNLNPTTGRITVADSSQLKYALQNKYVLTIQATLPDGTIGTYDVTINVKNVFGPNNSPTVSDSQFTIEEFSPVGTVVGSVSAVDPDSADPLSYAITGGNVGNAFKIDSKTGRITVNNQSVLKLRTTPSIVLQVAVQDTRIPRSTVYGRVEVFLTPRHLAVSTSPNSVQLLPVADGEADDLNNDGVFETINTTGDTIQIKGPPARRRGIMEFNLASVGKSKVVKGAFLTIYVQGNVGNNIPVSLYGYKGNGAVTASDATLGSLIATRNFSVTTAGDIKAYSIELNPALIQQIVAAGGTLGLVLRNDTNANAIIIDSSEGPADNPGDSLARRPSLNLILDDTSDDVVLVNTTNQALTVGRSTGSAFTTFAASALRQGVTFSDLLTGDFNGDGRLDIAGRNAANGQILVALAAANQFVTGAAWTTFSTATTFSDVVVGDFNGDGKDDLAARSAQGQLLVATSTGTKFNNLVFGTLPANLQKLTNVRVGDFNGDGRDDLAGVVATTGQVVVSISNGTSFTSSVWGTVPVGTANGTTDVIVGDFNGDGRDDLYTRQGARNQMVLQSTGSSFSNVLFGLLPAGVPYVGFRKGDFNGDGLDDILGFTATGASTIFKSSGASFAIVGGGTLPVPTQVIPPPTPANPHPAPTFNPSDVVVGDFNHDGKSDILVHNTLTTTFGNVSTTTQQLWVSLGTSPNGGPLTTRLWATINNTGPFTLLGVGNY